MDVQKALNFEARAEREAALRKALAPLGLPDWSVEVIVLMTADGRPREVNGHQCYELQISKRQAAQRLGCSPNTFAFAVSRLQQRGVVEVVAFAQRRTYFLSVDRVNELVPIADDPIDELGLFSSADGTEQPENRSALVSAGQRARVRVRDKYLSRDTCNRDRVRAPRAPTDRPLTLRELADDHVRAMDLMPLRDAFRDAVAQGWLEDDWEDKRKFLALCRHAATARNIHAPAKVVYAAVKRHDFQRVNQHAWDWAGQFLRDQQRESESDETVST